MNEQIIVAYDPDFDPSPRKSADLFDYLGPRHAFLIGLATALLMLMSVGFVVLGSMLLSGKSLSL